MVPMHVRTQIEAIMNVPGTPQVLECASALALFGGPTTESGAAAPHSKTLREERAALFFWVHGRNACEKSKRGSA
jgi:hypothetical protein